VTTTLAHGVGRSPGEPVRPLRALAMSPALIVLLLGGLALRLTIAYVLFPSSGFESDIASYTSWALTLGQHGPGGFYANAGFSDYPPGYLYLLWPIGLLAQGMADPSGFAAGLVKLPPILLDLAVGYVLYRLVLGWLWPGRRAETVALAAAALYVFNPVSFYDSALWGQSDAAGALVMLLGLAALIRGNSEGAASLAVLAALVKPQFGVVLLPLVAFVLLKRHLVRPGSGPRHAPWGPRPLSGWLPTQQGPVRLLTAALAALLTFLVLALPFGMGPWEYVDRMLGTAGGYSYLTVNAFNVWALVGAGGNPSLAASPLTWSDDTLPLLGPLPGVAVGAALLVGGFLWGTVRGALRDDRWTLIAALAFLAIAFFVLPTRVHERYIFPAIALLPLLAAVSRRWALALLLVSVGAFVNLHAILTVPLYGTDNVSGLPLGELFRTSPLVVLSAVLQAVVGLWAAWQLRPSLRTSPDAFDRAAEGPSGDATAPVTGALAWPAAGAAWSPPGATTGSPAGGSAMHPGASISSGPGWIRGPGVIDWLVESWTRSPLRADRSASLAREGRGRLDRFDLLAVTGLVLLALLVRGFRLEQPVDMYFDEVYHARTATEFLQDWEYGLRHDIYEFTHPHLAKYAMAWGIRLAGGNEVVGTQELGGPVLDAVLERRWGGGSEGPASGGDRLYTATGSSLRVYDLGTHELLAELPIAATALALDETAHELFVADARGRLLRLQTSDLGRPDAAEPVPEPFSDGPGTPVERLVHTDTSLVAIGTGSLSTFDPETGAPLSERFTFSATDAVALPWVDRVVVDTREVTDREQLARRLARALSGAPAEGDASPAGDAAATSSGDSAAQEASVRDEQRRLERLFEAQGSVVAAAYLDEAARQRLQDGIDAGELPGVQLGSGPLLAVSDHRGISILDASSLDLIDEVEISQGVTSMALDADGLDDPTIYAAAGDRVASVPILDDGPGFPKDLVMPGAVRLAAWNEPANLIHVAGVAPDGEPTVYVIEPHGNAVFTDVPLPLDPTRLLADTQPDHPERDRGELLAIGADGGLARVGIDGNAFGWRLPGMLMGALMAALLYLLVRVLFARRSIALLAGALVLAEGMLFVNARIAMNDVYVTTFIVLGALLFAPLYLAPRRPWTAVLLLLGAGLALGLALASKWVGLYAIGGLVLLVLFRSGLGRILAVLGMVLLTAVLGMLAIRPAPVEDPARNWLFLLLMLLLTGILAAASVRRPLPVTRGELRLAIVGPLVVGALLLGAGLLAPVVGGSTGPADPGDGSLTASAGSGLLGPGRLVALGGLAILGGLGVALVAWLAGRRGRGPLAAGVSEPADPGRGVAAWLLPGRYGGLPWLFTLACLVLLPVVVYIISYAPWIELGNSWGLPLIGSLPFMPPGNDAGQTLADLTASMYRYHDSLRAAHAASSPWWAWPLDLKPVWFFSAQYGSRSSGLIYDAGNLVIFWLGLPAMAFCGWKAWQRRSLSLGLLVILWAALWLPWTRIDRATFQYHVYASLPFLVMALAYLLAELWHGPSLRTWFLARASAAVAILGPLLLWLLRTPLCILAGTAKAHAGGATCAAEVTRTAQLSQGGSAAMLVLVAGTAMALVVAWWSGRRAARARASGDGAAGPSPATTMAWLVVVLLLTLAGVAASVAFLDTTTTTPLVLSSDVISLLLLVPFGVLAWLVLRARDARRFVLGVVAAAFAWLLVFYPNLSGLPMPVDLVGLYQGLLPTWNWDFQFAVNTDPAVVGGLIDAGTLLVGAVALGVVAVAVVAARAWDGRPRLREPAPGGEASAIPGRPGS
jgi:hypothetical protein